MKRYNLLIISILIILNACHRAPQFTVEGTIDAAAGDTLHLEQITDSAILSIDYAVLPADGHFTFSANQPNYPEFYRLRIGSESIVFAVDSCETIGIVGQKKKFATNYTVTNSENSQKIQQLRNSGFELQRAVNTAHANNTWDNAEITALIEQHKTLARQIIMSDTRSTASYYAVNQMVNGIRLFQVDNRLDRSYIGAVATAYKVFMPENPRTKLLEQHVLGAINAQNILQTEAELIGAIDIELPNRLGENVKLSSLKGKVVLVDFSAYALEQATTHTLFLRELYDIYHAAGFEIYQISLDENKLFWLEQTRTVPWVCVRDKQAPNCKYLLSYNVQSIPAWFLLDRNGDIVAGHDLKADNLQQSIERQLAKP
ncbi:MAG: thioredoxin-like domain-containing protein [Paludibacteraceae bacterium]